MAVLGTNDESKIGTTVHPFTASGMGEGPFRCVGFKSYPGGPFVVENGVANFENCRHCGTVIRDVYIIANAKGERFSVGSTCIGKVEPKDSQMVRYVSAKKRELAQHKAEVKRAAVWAELKAFMTDADVIAKAKSLPHPKDFKDFKTGEPLTYWDYMSWLFGQCGNAGRVKWMKVFKQELGINA